MSTLKFRKSAYLPHQWDYLRSDKKIKALVSGYGGGKTFVFVRETLKQHIFNKDPKSGLSNGWIIYPTNSLADELFLPEFIDLLTKLKIPYDYNTQRRVLTTRYGRIRMYQLQKPHRMVGSNLTYIGFDEFDIELSHNCKAAYEKGLARLRGCTDPRLFIVTTPEGFRETYRIFVKEFNDDKCLIHASTYDNHHLPDGYIELLEQEYDEKLLEGYLKGKFVNLTSGSVYYGFNRKLHVVPAITPMKLDPILDVYLCVDFNVNPMVWEVAQVRDKTDIRFIHEIKGVNTNTWDMCARLKMLLPAKAYNLVVFGDASGNARDTRSLQTDYSIIEQELRGHFNQMSYRVPVANPSVRSRIHAMNARLSKNNIRANAECVELVDDWEQVAYDMVGDINKKDMKRTHSSDAAGYMVVREFPIVVARERPTATIK